ncbi:MAG: hypothetical protein ACR2P5_03280 [Gammaproteobacteria bacterium]
MSDRVFTIGCTMLATATGGGVLASMIAPMPWAWIGVAVGAVVGYWAMASNITEES